MPAACRSDGGIRRGTSAVLLGADICVIVIARCVDTKLVICDELGRGLGDTGEDDDDDESESEDKESEDESDELEDDDGAAPETSEPKMIF